jgi:hypothetical protein
VSVSTAARWAGRYRDLGEAGMADRSSRPRTSPARTPTPTERRVIKVRVIRRWGPARIAYLLGLNPSTVHRILSRYRLAPLTHLDRATATPFAATSTPRPVTWCTWTSRSRATSPTAAATGPLSRVPNLTGQYT